MMRGRKLSLPQGILRLKSSYVHWRKGEALTLQESCMNADRIWGWAAVLRNDAFTDGI